MGIWACHLGSYGSSFSGKMKKMMCEPVHREVSCLKFADYRVTDSCLLNVVSVHAMRAYGEYIYIHSFLTSALNLVNGQCHAQSVFTFSGKEPSVHPE